MITAVKHSRRLHKGITKDKYFLPEAAEEDNMRKVCDIRCSRDVPREKREEAQHETATGAGQEAKSRREKNEFLDWVRSGNMWQSW